MQTNLITKQTTHFKVSLHWIYKIELRQNEYRLLNRFYSYTYRLEVHKIHLGHKNFVLAVKFDL